MTFTVENLECYMLILVRLAAFIYTMPIISANQIPRKVKAGLAVFFSFIVYNAIPIELPEYGGIISLGILILQESLVGIMLGYITNVCLYIVNFSGRLIDMEIGLSMANMMDPATKLQSSVTGAYYTQFVSILLILSNMHYYLIRAVIDSFKYVPIGKAVIDRSIYEIMQSFMVDFFIIGFRIILPIFAATLTINVVLGVLARIAPQMNMFVIGMPLKVFVGIIILMFITGTFPTIADFIFSEMKEYLNIMMKALSP